MGRRRQRRGRAMSSRSNESDLELEPEPEQARVDQLDLCGTETKKLSWSRTIGEMMNLKSQFRRREPSTQDYVIDQVDDAEALEVTVENPANAQQREEMKKSWELCTSLYKAALTGDWNAAKTALGSDKRAGCVQKITVRGGRPLHVAALAKQTEFVQKLVNYMNEGDLEVVNNDGNTAFIHAAMSGVVEIAKAMYQKNNALPTIRNRRKRSPIETAARVGDKKMVEYLYKITPLNNFEARELMNILCATINGEMYDIALKILEAYGSIVTSPNVNIGNALCALARKPFSHYGTSQKWICESLDGIVPYVPCFKRLYGSIEKQRQAGQLVEKLCERFPTLEEWEIINLFRENPILDDAAKIGNDEFFTLLSRLYPDLIWRHDSNNCTIFHLAVIYRQEKVFSLIYHIGALKDIFLHRVHRGDDSKNNILHLAAKLAPSDRLNIVSGAALQMQREILWFKEVEKNILPSYVQRKNKDGKTPRELFTEQHEKLREAGEGWMKGTATSCMVVATLIATVAFAAAFTVPGGNKEETGAPIFLNNTWFTVFVISDAVAMFSSTASIMMFLSILTSRYGEEDFLYKLPAKLTVGLFTLFASIVCMVLTFSATFFLVYVEEKLGILPKIVASLSLLPITLYAMLNFRLWISLIHSTIWASRYMFRPGKHRLFK